MRFRAWIVERDRLQIAGGLERPNNLQYVTREGTEVIKAFFEATVRAIQIEEQELNQLFNINKDLYQKHHHGVCSLYETTFVYLVFKELLKQEYPFMIFWEQPYPENNKEHSDLGIRNENGDLEALVEFKIWKENHDKEIKADIAKLNKVRAKCRKLIVVLGYGGDIEENNKFLLKENPSLRFIDKEAMKTKFFKSELGRVEDNALNVFFYEVESRSDV